MECHPGMRTIRSFVLHSISMVRIKSKTRHELWKGETRRRPPFAPLDHRDPSHPLRRMDGPQKTTVESQTVPKGRP
jgi:hypothetical protein